VAALEQAVASSDVFLAVIGRHWLTCTEDDGRRRLELPDDWVRVEVSTALERNVLTIPVLVHDAHMPASSELPLELAGFARRQGITIRDDRWQDDVDDLIKVIEDHLPNYQERRPTALRVVPLGKTGLLLLALAALLFAGLLAVYARAWPSFDSSPPPSDASDAWRPLYDFEGDTERWTVSRDMPGAKAIRATRERASSGRGALEVQLELPAGGGMDERGAAVAVEPDLDDWSAVREVAVDVYAPEGTELIIQVFVLVGNNYDWRDSGTHPLRPGTWTTVTWTTDGVAGRGSVQELGLKLGSRAGDYAGPLLIDNVRIR
jgi:hypothetical protein